MSRRRTLGTKKKLALLAGAAAVAGGGAFVAANASNAAQTAPGAQTRAAGDSTVCQGLATALGNNLRFIDGQRADPDAQSEARIANREAVVAEIERKQEASGCTAGESAPAPGSAASPQSPPASQPAQTSQPAQAGEQVCTGSTVTLSGEGGAPAASSNQFPLGTTLRVTNLDNDKSTTVTVDSVSGSCALLNDAAFEEVREDGKFLIRRALIEKVG
ncbi:MULTISPECIES: hypothetical protein [Streptomyces]|uniref:hypothetical protein n=1 Tax=Streptomyces TaxID=1883 RepID=UPI0018855509|nr:MULTISPECIES: hypothetical protein [Streptomyces]MBZ6131981.1 hypothetical protein [Streptomyces olivaceus]MBZ6253429.1 hypothetical protein [Streptomyces olivaceus]MCU8595762.1 hypothetical protein [Streptomyces sp. A13(2022)]WFB83505.1 hypothetical protein MMU79_09315 [Streptomyces olivaceus]WGK45808.1 hypothetical protein M6G09_09340 [Streptomyces sp. B146]